MRMRRKDLRLVLLISTRSSISKQVSMNKMGLSSLSYMMCLIQQTVYYVTFFDTAYYCQDQMTGSMYYLKDYYSHYGRSYKDVIHQENTSLQIDYCIVEHPTPDVEQEFDEMLQDLILILDDHEIAV